MPRNQEYTVDLNGTARVYLGLNVAGHYEQGFMVVRPTNARDLSAWFLEIAEAIEAKLAEPPAPEPTPV